MKRFVRQESYFYCRSKDIQFESISKNSKIIFKEHLPEVLADDLKPVNISNAFHRTNYCYINNRYTKLNIVQMHVELFEDRNELIPLLNKRESMSELPREKNADQSSDLLKSPPINDRIKCLKEPFKPKKDDIFATLKKVKRSELSIVMNIQSEKSENLPNKKLISMPKSVHTHRFNRHRANRMIEQKDNITDKNRKIRIESSNVVPNEEAFEYITPNKIRITEECEAPQSLILSNSESQKIYSRIPIMNMQNDSVFPIDRPESIANFQAPKSRVRKRNLASSSVYIKNNSSSSDDDINLKRGNQNKFRPAFRKSILKSTPTRMENQDADFSDSGNENIPANDEEFYHWYQNEFITDSEIKSEENRMTKKFKKEDCLSSKKSKLAKENSSIKSARTNPLPFSMDLLSIIWINFLSNLTISKESIEKLGAKERLIFEGFLARKKYLDAGRMIWSHKGLQEMKEVNTKKRSDENIRFILKLLFKISKNEYKQKHFSYSLKIQDILKDIKTCEEREHFGFLCYNFLEKDMTAGDLSHLRDFQWIEGKNFANPTYSKNSLKEYLAFVKKSGMFKKWLKKYLAKCLIKQNNGIVAYMMREISNKIKKRVIDYSKIFQKLDSSDEKLMAKWIWNIVIDLKYNPKCKLPWSLIDLKKAIVDLKDQITID